MRLELLKQLTEAAGIPGYEDRLRAIVIPELEAVCDEVSVDALGNVIGVKRGTGSEPRRKVMLAGHIDEIGFMVKYISDDGFLRLQALGGFDPRALFQVRVMVHASDGKSYRGVLPPPRNRPISSARPSAASRRNSASCTSISRCRARRSRRRWGSATW